MKPCSAQLDGAALEVLLAQDPAWDGLRGSAQDVWAGHKEDQQKVPWSLYPLSGCLFIYSRCSFTLSSSSASLSFAIVLDGCMQAKLV